MFSSGLGQAFSAQLERRLERLATSQGIPFCVVHPDGSQKPYGEGPEQFRVVLHTARAQNAFARFDMLSIAETYMEGELEIEGDLFAALRYQEYVDDRHPLLRLASRLEPILIGRERANPRWVRLHYDARNAQLLGADSSYHTYTPGEFFCGGGFTGGRRRTQAGRSVSFPAPDGQRSPARGWLRLGRHAAIRCPAWRTRDGYHAIEAPEGVL